MYELIPIAAIIVTGALLFPVIVAWSVRRVRGTPTAPPATRDPAIARLEAELLHTREELHRLAERQQFVEALLEKRTEPTSLPR